MSDEQGTLNTEAGQSGTAGDSSPPKASSDGDLVHTVDVAIPTIPQEGQPPEGGAKPEGDQEGATEAKDGKGTDKGAEPTDSGKGKTTDEEFERFDKHPRFQELHNKVQAAEARATKLETELESVKTQKPGDKPSGEKLPFKDITGMTDEEMLEWQQDDPKGYYANVLHQAKHELTGELRGEMQTQNYEAQVEHTFNEFAKDNPEFDAMWDRGELQRYMQTNPGHNAISAYLALTQAKTIEDKVAEGVKDEREKIEKDLRAKRETQTLPSGPSATGSSTVAGQTPQELKDTKKFGGLTTVLAKRSEERQKQRSGG